MFTARYGLDVFIQIRLIILVFFQTVPLVGRLVAGLSPQKPGFDSKTDHVRPVMDKVALGQIYLPVLHFSPVSIIPPTLHNNLQLHVALTRRTNERILGTFQKQCCFANRGTLDRRVVHLLSYGKGYMEVKPFVLLFRKLFQHRIP